MIGNEHLKAEHMAAPTNAANVKKASANSEPLRHMPSLGAVHTWRHIKELSFPARYSTAGAVIPRRHDF